MNPAETPKPPARSAGGRRAGAVAVLGFLAVASLGLGIVYLAEQASLRSWSRRTEVIPPHPPMRIGFMAPGLETPETLSAQDARLTDDRPVLGIEAGGLARAYDLGSMKAPTRHIVNDVVGGEAVTVTYCDLDECARAFTSEGRTTHLDLSQAGVFGSKMLVKVGHVVYEQATGAIFEHDQGHAVTPFPYAERPLVLTTWGAWKARHPDTDVFVYRGTAPAVPAPGR